MKTHSKRIAAAVMIGGQSKRMGQPKEEVLLPVSGITFLDKVCGEIDKCIGKCISGRYLSVRKGQKKEREGYLSVVDLMADTGPMGGILAVLLKAFEDGFDAVLFLACDMIHMEAAEIERICAAYQEEDILFARTGKQLLQPLCSIYKTGITGHIKKQMETGNYRLRSLTDTGLVIGYFDTEHPAMYDNINRMEELKRCVPSGRTP